MKQTISRRGPYLISALLGAFGGGILVIIATRAIPNMMANMLSGMMGKMMSHMGECGCNPQQM